ncbi:MAG TPA: hypothetical protein VFA46_02600 [Actinomycetes bacterium]|nr:hypothetical protein [Actinomycetes bacterium]
MLGVQLLLARRPGPRRRRLPGPNRLPPRRQHHRPPSRRPRGGTCNVSIPTVRPAAADAALSWPKALRRVRAWLAPLVWLQRCWRGWSASPPPRQLQQALDWVMAGQPIYLYLPP